MDKETPSPTKSSFITRFWKALGPPTLPTDDRGRMRMVVDNIVLHLHPTKIPESTLRWSYTWGLGGLATLLVLILGLTGTFLELNYTPRPEQAYLDILALKTNVWFGDFLRNLHHWSANLLIVVVVLHLWRVFFTAAYRDQRANNWIIGIFMLLLVLGENFTGYLLPWDQLAYWAITVGTGILSYLPIIGAPISQTLLGGPEVSAATLLNFYSLHISFIPIAILALMSLHFWRIRKDGGLTISKREDPAYNTNIKRVTTIPYLVRRELIWALIWMGILLFWAALVPAPLEGIANPEISPNPAKAPWYFLGIQELLLHLHPLIGGIIVPILVVVFLLLLPFYDADSGNVGIYFRSLRGRYLSLIAVGTSLIITTIWLVADEFFLNWNTWLPTWPSLVSEGIIPLALILLGLLILDELVKKWFKANLEERILFFFVFLFSSLVVLTVVGIFFRGPSMSLIWPWQATIH